MSSSSGAQRSLGKLLEGWLTRNEASDLCGCSVNTIMNWQRQGLLHPVRGMQPGSIREIWLYDPHELARMPKKRAAPFTPGERESRAFEMFDRGRSVRAVVIALRITSDEAWAIRERWIDAGAEHPTIEIDAKGPLADRTDDEIETGINAAIDDELGAS